MHLKRILYAIPFVLAFSLCPMTAFAVSGIADGSGETWGGIYWTIDEGRLVISPAEQPEAGYESGVIPGNSYSSLSGVDASAIEHFWRWQAVDLKKKTTSVKIEPGVRLAGSAERMFSSWQTLKSVDLSGLDASEVTSTASMFRGCFYLESVDLTGIDTSSVTSMSGMFYQAGMWASAFDIDVSAFDTSQVRDASAMFYDCRTLASLDVTGFATGNMTDIGSMFASCANLSELDLSNFDTSAVQLDDGFLERVLDRQGSKLLLGPKTRLSAACGLSQDDSWARPDGSAVYDADGLIGASEAGLAEGTWVFGGKGSIDKAALSLDQAAFEFDGVAKEPQVTVSLGGRALEQDSEYTVAYSDNLDAGTGSVVVAGIGSCEGEIAGRFVINPASLAKAQVTLDVAAFTYDGKPKAPSFKVTLGSKTLVKDVDYTATYESNVNPGTAKVVVDGAGNYTGTATATFSIAAKQEPVKQETAAPSQEVKTPSANTKAPSANTKAPSANTKAPSKKKVLKANPMRLSGKRITVTYKKLRRANQTFARSKAIVVKSAKGELTFKRVSGNKKIVVNPKTGKVTVKKGLRANVYKVKVNVTAAGTGSYKKATKPVIFSVRVKR